MLLVFSQNQSDKAGHIKKLEERIEYFNHRFNRNDTQRAQKIRVKIYKFLAQYLNRPNPLKTVNEWKKAAYRF